MYIRINVLGTAYSDYAAAETAGVVSPSAKAVIVPIVPITITAAMIKAIIFLKFFMIFSFRFFSLMRQNHSS